MFWFAILLVSFLVVVFTTDTQNGAHHTLYALYSSAAIFDSPNTPYQYFVCMDSVKARG